MTIDPERALQRALIDTLRADAGLKALLGDPARIWDEPPKPAPYPHLLIGRSESRPVAADGGATEHVITLTCRSDYGGAEEAKAVTAAVRAALHDQAPALEGHRVVTLRVTYVDVFRASDWLRTLGVVRLRAVTEPMED